MNSRKMKADQYSWPDSYQQFKENERIQQVMKEYKGDFPGGVKTGLPGPET